MPTQLNAAAFIDSSRCVQIGTVHVDFATHSVTRLGGEVLRLSPKAAQVLAVLIAHRDTPVHRDVLFSSVWPGQFRTDDVITKVMQELRRALAHSADIPAIETIPRVGYQLKLPVQCLEDVAVTGTVAARVADAADTLHSADCTETKINESLDADAPVIASGAPQGAYPEKFRANWRRTSIIAWLVGVAILSALSLVLVVKSTFVVTKNAESTDAVNVAPKEANWFASATLTPRVSAVPFSTDPGDEMFSAISPDGKLVAISTQSLGDTRYQLRLRSVADGVDRLLVASTAGDEVAPVFSPDGTSIAYFRRAANACTIEIADVFGIAYRVLAECAPGPVMSIEFFPDAKALLVPWMALTGLQRRSGFARIDLESGKQSNFQYASAGGNFDLEARFSPDGKKLLVHSGFAPFSSLALHHLNAPQSNAPVMLGEQFSTIHGITWLPDNRHVVLASDRAGTMALWRLDTQSAAIESFSGILGEFPSAARTSDALTFVRNERAASLSLLRQHDPSASPASEKGGLKSLQRSEVFASTRSEHSPALAYDATQIAFVSDRSGSAQIYLAQLPKAAEPAEQRIDAGQAVRITQLQSGLPMQLSFSADGKQLAFGLRDGAETSVWLMDLATRALTSPQLLHEHAIDLRFGAKPGELLFAALDQANQFYIYSQQANLDQIAEHASVRQISSCQGRAPRDGGDGYIYFFAPDVRALKRVRADATGAACEYVSDRVRWLNRGAWVADSAGVIALLSRLDRVEQAGVYRLSEPPKLLLALPELSRRPQGLVEMVAANSRLIVALPAAQSGDVWLVRGLDSNAQQN